MKPIGSPWWSANGSSRCGAERVGEQRVVAELGVGVEREVVGGEGDVGVEQDLQAALERRVDRPGPEPQNSPWWTISSSARSPRGELEQLGVAPRRRVARVCDLSRPGTCRPLGP